MLARLIDMGIFDWEDPDVEGHESRQSMRHSSAMVSRLLKRIETLETKVRIMVNGRYCPSDHYSFHRIQALRMASGNWKLPRIITLNRCMMM